MGAMRVSPSTGTAVSAPFLVSFENFVAPKDDYPLFFSVYQDLAGDTVASERMLMLLASSMAPEYQVVLTQVSSIDASVLGIVATASGVTSEYSHPVKLFPYASILSGEAKEQAAALKTLYVELELAVESAMQNLDTQKALQIVVAACGILNNLTAGTAGRSAQLRHHLQTNSTTMSLGASTAAIAASLPRGASENLRSNIEDASPSFTAIAYHFFKIKEYIRSWLMPHSAASVKQSDGGPPQNDSSALLVSTVRPRANERRISFFSASEGVERGKRGSAVTEDVELIPRESVAKGTKFRSFFLGILKSAFDVSSLSQEELGSFSVALGIVMQNSDAGLAAQDVPTIISLLNRISIGTASSPDNVPRWHTSSLVQIAGGTALLLNTHAASLIAEDYAAFSLQVQDAVRRTIDVLDRPLFVGEAASFIRTTELSVSVSKTDFTGDQAQASKVCLYEGAQVFASNTTVIRCVHLTVPRQLTQGARKVLIIKIAFWRNPLYLLPAQFDAVTQGPMVQFDLSAAEEGQGRGVAAIDFNNTSLDRGPVFRMEGLETRSDSLSSCMWFDAGRQRWRREGVLASQPLAGAIDCRIIVQMNNLAVLSELITYDTHGMQVPSSISTVMLGGLRVHSSLVAVALLIVIATAALVTSLGVCLQCVRAAQLATSRTLGVDHAVATNLIAPEHLDDVGLDTSESMQGFCVILLRRHPLLSLLWSNPRAEPDFFARLVSFCVTISSIMTCAMILFAYEFPNAFVNAFPESHWQWLEVGVVAGLLGIPIYYMARAPFSIGQQFRMLSMETNRRLMPTNRKTNQIAASQESPVTVSTGQLERRLPMSSAVSVSWPERDASNARALAFDQLRQEEEEEIVFTRPGGAGTTESETFALSHVYAPDASTPIPMMPTFARTGGAGIMDASHHSQDAGELPSSMFKEYDLLAVAARKLSEHQLRHQGVNSPLLRPTEVEIDWTCTPCPSPRKDAHVRSSRTHSRRTSRVSSGRSTPTLPGAPPVLMLSSRSLAGSQAAAGIRAPFVAYRPPPRLTALPGQTLNACDAQDASTRLHRDEAPSSAVPTRVAARPPRSGTTVAGGSFGSEPRYKAKLGLTELVIPPAPPPSPRRKRVRANAAIQVAMDTSPTLQAASDYLQTYEPAEDSSGTEEAGASQMTAAAPPHEGELERRHAQNYHQLPRETEHATAPAANASSALALEEEMPSDDDHPSLQFASQLPGAICDDASEISGALSRSASPVFTGTDSVTHDLHVSPVQVDRHMSPGELDWSPNTAPPSRAFAATYSSPQRLMLSGSDAGPRRLSSTVTRTWAGRSDMGASAGASFESCESSLLRNASRLVGHGHGQTPRPRNLEPILGDELSLHSKPPKTSKKRELSSIPQEGDDEYEALSVERHASPYISTWTHDALFSDGEHQEQGRGQVTVTRLGRLRDSAPPPLAVENGGEELQQWGEQHDSFNDAPSPSRSPRRLRRQQTAVSRLTDSVRSKGMATLTGVIIFCGALVMFVATLIRAIWTFLSTCIALFPVVGPILQVYVLLAIQLKATEWVAPSLRPGLDEAWLFACALAVGEWLLMHSCLIWVQVIVVRRTERQRLLEDVSDDNEQSGESESSEEDIRPHERNAQQM
jgi:hypothetical protein